MPSCPRTVTVLVILCYFHFTYSVTPWAYKFCIIDVIRNSAIVGIPQLIPRYKQTFTVIASQCTTVYNRVTNVFDKFTLINAKPPSFNCKSLFVTQD